MFARLGNVLGSRTSDSVATFHDIVSARAGLDERTALDEVPRRNVRPSKLALVGASPLLQQCLSRAVSGRLNFEFSTFASIEEWRTLQDAESYALVILFASSERQGRDVAAVARALETMGGRPHFAVLSDSERAAEIMAAFECGAKAYIPTSVTVEVMIEAINLVIAGGAYWPTSVLKLCSGQGGAFAGAPRQPACDLLTPRETAVLKAVRMGRPNKVIAHELGISESTIKVHVHRIMKKLKVQNRTQVAICALPNPGE
jgi:DNA-binding NarL/FixJ family response regulator